MPKKPSFQVVLTALADTSTAFPARYHELFSDLAQADLAALMKLWPDLPKTRKRSLLSKLVEVYKEDTVLSFEELAAAVLDDSDEHIRSEALRLLVETSNTRILPRVIELATSDPSVDVQARAASVLGSFVELGELEEIVTEALRQVEETLLKLARAENADLQRAAIESLGYSSRPETEVIIQNAYTRHDPKWVASALLAMGRSANAHWEELVLSKLSDPDDDVRRNAVQASGELRLEAARQFLLDLLEEEEDDAIFAAAVWALSQIGGEDVRVTLETLLDQAEDDEIIEYIEEALANLDFTEEMNAFDLLSLDPDDDPEK